MGHIFRIGIKEELSEEQLLKFIKEHRDFADVTLRPLMNAYVNKYEISESEEKGDRITVNFVGYIVDAMNDFFISQPINVISDEEEITNYLNLLNRYNALDNHNAELSKLCSIFGRGYEMYFVDEDGNIVITSVSPMNAFMVYDDSIIERPKYFVRTYVDHNDVFRGNLYTETHIRTFFLASGNVMWEKEKMHGFDGVPATEFIENKERIGSLHSVMPMITDVTDEDVRMAFGIAPQYKLQGMVNLIKTKQRKFMLGMDRRYKLIFSNPVSDMKKDDWMKIRYRFLV